MTKKSKSTIFQLGNDQLTTKATYYPNELKKFNFETFYFSEDRSGLSKNTINEEKLDAVIAPKGILMRWYKLLIFFIKKRPVAIELYLSQRPWHLLYYFILAKIFKSKVIIWCRGELRNYFKHHPLRRFTNKFLLKNANNVLLRELYMKKILEEAAIYRKNVTLFFPNAIAIDDVYTKNISSSNNVLFLNSFKSFRNIELIIEAAEILNAKYPEIKFYLVGSTLDNKNYSPSKEDYELMLRKMVSDKKLNKVIMFYPFSSDRFKYFEDAFTFVLPADHVFCNYTLLEAMSQRIPPIVANTEGSDLIVDHEVSGLIVDRNCNDIAKGIERLYLDKALIDTMGKKSREKVINDYNVALRAEALCKLYKGS